MKFLIAVGSTQQVENLFTDCGKKRSESKKFNFPQRLLVINRCVVLYSITDWAIFKKKISSSDSECRVGIVYVIANSI